MQYVDTINVDDYNRLRRAVGWTDLPVEEAQAGLDNSAYEISCIDGEKTVALARMVWDHGYIAYLSDVIVDEQYRGKGIGRYMVNYLVEKMKEQVKPGWKIKISLMAAFGKEGFYEKLNFVKRPNDNSGAGMEMWLK